MLKGLEREDFYEFLAGEGDVKPHKLVESDAELVRLKYENIFVFLGRSKL